MNSIVAPMDRDLVGERTVATSRGAFEFGERRTIEAKGKPERVECRRLVRGLSLMRPQDEEVLRVGQAETTGAEAASVSRAASPSPADGAPRR